MASFVLTALFTAPQDIGTDPASMLLLLPLAASIAIVYKATKVSRLTLGNFVKEVSVLFASIIIFMVVTAVILLAIARVATG